MNSIQQNDKVVMVIGNRVWINGEELSTIPTKRNGSSITQIDGQVYIDGYECKKGKWTRTLRALWHLWF